MQDSRWAGPSWSSLHSTGAQKTKDEEQWNLKLELSNMLQNYNLGKTEKVSIIKNWLGIEGLQLTATRTQEEQEACNNEKDLFNTFNRILKHQYNERIKSLQFCKLIKQPNESVEEWMGRIRTAVVEYNYKEIDRKKKTMYTWLK